MSREAEWIVQAIEAVGKTAEKDGEYWRASYTEQDRKATALCGSIWKRRAWKPMSMPWKFIRPNWRKG